MMAATPIFGVGDLTKSDTGTLVLTGNYTYTGATSITGMLALILAMQAMLFLRVVS